MANERIYADMGLYRAKAESTPGTDSVPTYADNVIYCLESSMKLMVAMIDMTRKKHAFTSPGALPGKRWCEHSFKMPMCGSWGRPLYQDVPIPDFDVLLKSSNHARTDTSASAYTAAVRNNSPQYYDISAGATLVVSIDGGADDTFTLDHGTPATYPDNTRATAAQIVADIGADVTTAGATITAYRGYLWLKSNDATVAASIRVQAATAASLAFTEGVTVSGAQLKTARTYAPDSFNASPTCTIYGDLFTSGGKANGKTYQIKSTGCVFNAEFSIKTDGECDITFTGKGTYRDPADVNFPTGVAIGNMTDGMVGIDASIEIDAVDGNDVRCDCLSELTFTPNWDVQEIPCLCAESGIEAFFATRKQSITGSMNPMARLVADYDRWALVKNANRNTIEAILTSPQGSVVTINMTNVQLGSPEMDYNGIVRYNQSFYLRDNSVNADDQYTVKFTCVET